VIDSQRDRGEIAVSKMTIDKNYFTTRSEVMDDVRDSGYWPTTYISNKSPELPVHYHDHDIIGYVIEGETYVLDEDEQKIPVGPGDRLVIPKGAWHAEGEVTERVIYIVSLRDAVPLMEGLMPREPRGPFPSFD
jgi:mannose-6-phosphate isomerase-like protein (cupin superfamily)